MMNRGANSVPIPMDLILEILSRLPAKSVARFRCVSKPWKSIICRQDFTKLFRTMSSSNPRLLIGIEQRDQWSFFSSLQPKNHYGKSSLVVAADFLTKFSGGYFSYASGLFYFTKFYDDHAVRVICNPNTGQYAILPPDMRTSNTFPDGLLVFDPIGKQFKVLVLNERVDDGLVYHILTLGAEKMRWREIKCPSFYGPDDSVTSCINGVLYYKASYSKIGCFDVRSEKFKFINVDPHVKIGYFQSLINYKGKLCVSYLKYGDDGGFPLKLHMWVLEDIDLWEWSTYTYTLIAEDTIVKVKCDLFVVGVTASGEIVLAKKEANKQFYVFYFNPERNTLLSVEIQSIVEEEWSPYRQVHCFVDHVEDLNFDVFENNICCNIYTPT